MKVGGREGWKLVNVAVITIIIIHFIHGIHFIQRR